MAPHSSKVQAYTHLYWCVSCIYREGNGTPLQYSCLENPMDGGAWWAAVHGVTKSRTRLSNFTFTFHFHALEKEMATHSSVLAWRIPGMGEPSGPPSMGLHSVGHDWSNLAAAAESSAWWTGGMQCCFHCIQSNVRWFLSVPFLMILILIPWISWPLPSFSTVKLFGPPLYIISIWEGVLWNYANT